MRVCVCVCVYIYTRAKRPPARVQTNFRRSDYGFRGDQREGKRGEGEGGGGARKRLAGGEVKQQLGRIETVRFKLYSRAR